MSLELIKIINYFITYAELSNYIYKPSDVKLSSLILSELANDSNLRFLFNSNGIKEYIASIEVIGAVTPEQLYEFLQRGEGRSIIKIILNDSSYIDREDADVEGLINEVMDELSLRVRD